MVPTLRNLALPVAAGLAVMLSSCGEQDTHERIMTDTLNLLEELATTLEGASNKESARSASEQILNLAGKFEEIADRSDAVGKPTTEIKKALTESHGDRRSRVLARIGTASSRVKTLKDERLSDSLRKLGEIWSALP